MLFIVCISLLLYAFYEYITGYKEEGALIFFFFLTDGFQFLNSEWIPIKYRDFAYIYLIGVCLLNLFSENRKFFKPDNRIFRITTIIGIYITIEFFRTIIFKEESFSFALANYRTYLPFFSFFLVQELKSSEVIFLFKRITLLTILGIILFDIQPLLDIKTLQHASITEENGTLRYRNIPYLTYFYLIYATILFSLKNIKSILLLLLSLIAIILTQHRAIIISYVCCMFIYFALSRKTTKIIYVATIGIFVTLIFGDALLSRLERKDSDSSTWDDIENVIQLDYSNAVRSNYENEPGGNFSFRVLLLMERFQYLTNNTEQLLFGIGTRHEDSPKTKKQFDFILGSMRRSGDIGQISSGDLVWVNPLMRFGIIGIGILLYFSWLTLTFLYKNRKNSNIAMGSFLFYLFLILISFKNDHLYGEMQLFFIFMLIQYINTSKNKYISKSTNNK